VTFNKKSPQHSSDEKPEKSSQSIIKGDHSPDHVKFPDNSLTVRDTPAHVKRYSYHAFTSVTVSGGGRNATVPDMKPKRNPQTQQSQEQTQITINSFRQLFPDKIFSRHLPNF